MLIKKGIEGAAVTAGSFETTSEPNETIKVYNNFVIDRAFGFVLTDSYDTVLFSGVVNKI